MDSLRTLWRDGLSASEIAQRLGGVTRNAVLGKLHRLDLLGGRVRTGQISAKPPAAPKARKPRAPATPKASRAVTPRTPSPSIAAALALSGTVRRLEQLGRRDCRWPIGDPADDGFAFCGRAAGKGPYCCAHAAVAYRPLPLTPRRRAKRRALACAA